MHNIYSVGIYKIYIDRDGLVKIYKVFIFLMILSSCGNQSETSIDIAHRMKNLACMGDVEGFYSHIDNLSVERNLQKLAIEGIKEEVRADPSSLREFKEIVIPSLIVLKWEVMSRDLANGEEGTFCNIQITNVQGNDKNVSILFPDGKTSSWSFEDNSGRLVLVSIVDEAPFDFADLEIGLRSKSKRSVQTKNEVSKQKVDIVSPESKDDKPTEITKSEITSNIIEEDKEVVVAKEEPSKRIEESKQLTNTENMSSQGLSRPGYDFGSGRWGMTKEQVVALEGSSPTSETDSVLKYNGKGAELDYVFSGNKLIRGLYVLSGPSSDEQTYIGDYERVKRLLTNRYGEPQIDQELWTNSTYKDKPDRHGFAVYIGHLSYKAKWVTARSDISLELKSNNYNMMLEAVYRRR